MVEAPLTEAQERAARAPLVPDELARRLEAATTAYCVEWLEPPARRADPPRGLRMKRFGQAVAFAAPGAPDLDFLNRIHGLWPEEAGRVPDLARWYRTLGLRFWIEVVPVAGVAAVVAALERLGAERLGHHCVVWGKGTVGTGGDEAAAGAGSAVTGRAAGEGAVGAAREIRVAELEQEQVAGFVETLLDGHEVPRPGRKELDLHSHWSGCAGWRFYRAVVGGHPAGAGVLRIGEGVGLLATASTVPRYRGRGVQGALIARRVDDAGSAGCEVVTSAATAGSTSLLNLERAGLRPAFTKTVWRLRH